MKEFKYLNNKKKAELLRKVNSLLGIGYNYYICNTLRSQLNYEIDARYLYYLAEKYNIEYLVAHKPSGYKSSMWLYNGLVSRKIFLQKLIEKLEQTK